MSISSLASIGQHAIDAVHGHKPAKPKPGIESAATQDTGASDPSSALQKMLAELRDAAGTGKAATGTGAVTNDLGKLANDVLGLFGIGSQAAASPQAASAAYASSAALGN